MLAFFFAILAEFKLRHAAYHVYFRTVVALAAVLALKPYKLSFL
jgi:hypothetical protein